MRMYKLIVISFFFFLLFLIPLAFIWGIEVRIENPLEYDDLRDLVEGIINFIFWVATAVTPLMIVIGAFYFVTSAGNPRQIDTAKKIILYTLIGYAIILLSKGLILVLEDILGVTS